MLYKKVHRQYLREFRVGRKLKFRGIDIVYEITKEPFIMRVGYQILVERSGCHMMLISLLSGMIYQYKDKNELLWLED